MHPARPQPRDPPDGCDQAERMCLTRPHTVHASHAIGESEIPSFLK